MGGRHSIASATGSRWLWAVSSFALAGAVGYAGVPAPAYGHEIAPGPVVPANASPAAPLGTANAVIASVETSPSKLPPRSNPSRNDVSRGQPRAVRFAARIDAAARRHARRIGRAQARHSRWVARAVADLRTPKVARYERLAREAARRHGVPVALVRAVILVESRYDARAVSHAGAMGLMQLMPATAAGLQVGDPFNARQNVFGGARLLRALGDTFHDPVLAIAAYNAGATAVRRYGGVPPYRETRQYVGRVLRAYQHYRKQRAPAPPRQLEAERAARPS